MRVSGRNGGPMMVVVDKSLKRSSVYDGEELEEQVRNHLVANEEEIKITRDTD